MCDDGTHRHLEVDDVLHEVVVSLERSGWAIEVRRQGRTRGKNLGATGLFNLSKELAEPLHSFVNHEDVLLSLSLVSLVYMKETDHKDDDVEWWTGWVEEDIDIPSSRELEI